MSELHGNSFKTICNHPETVIATGIEIPSSLPQESMEWMVIATAIGTGTGTETETGIGTETGTGTGTETGIGTETGTGTGIGTGGADHQASLLVDKVRQNSFCYRSV